MAVRNIVRLTPIAISLVIAYIARIIFRIYFRTIDINFALKLIIGYGVFLAVFFCVYWLITNYTDI